MTKQEIDYARTVANSSNDLCPPWVKDLISHIDALELDKAIQAKLLESDAAEIHKLKEDLFNHQEKVMRMRNKMYNFLEDTK